MPPAVSLSSYTSADPPLRSAVVTLLQLPSSPIFCLPAHSSVLAVKYASHFWTTLFITPQAESVRSLSTRTRYCLRMSDSPDLSSRTTRVTEPVQFDSDELVATS